MTALTDTSAARAAPAEGDHAMTRITREERIAAQIEALQRLAEQPDEDVEALGSDVPAARIDPILERVFATLEARRAAALAADEPLSFTPDPEETSPMTADTPPPGTAAEQIARVVIDGIPMIRFAVSLLRQGPGAVEPALLRLRSEGSEGRPEDFMPWRPRHLEFEGSGGAGQWLLWIDYREVKASPDSPPDIAVRVDGLHVDEDDFTVDYTAADGQLCVILHLDAEPFFVALPETDADRLLVNIETAA